MSFVGEFKKYGFTKNIDWNNFSKLLIILLIPALLRHFTYITTFNTTGVFPSVSFETVQFFQNSTLSQYLVKIIIEEIILSAVFSFIYFFNHKLRFLSFGYLIDPLVDLISTIPIYFTGEIFLKNQIIRELIIPYILLGFILFQNFENFQDLWKKVYALNAILLIFQIILLFV